MDKLIDSVLRWARTQFETCSESPRLDAELLLAHCLDKPRSYLYSHPEAALDETSWACFEALVARRQEPTPIAYLLGSREFYSLDFHTRPQALVPRPETEILVEQALALIPEQIPVDVCDLGTGTGIIAITLKKLRPQARLVATDVDPECLALARENADRHDVRIDWYEADWYRGLPTGLAFDLIVSNPPYIAAAHPFLERGDLPAEPSLALTPGATGLEALEQIVAGAGHCLVPGGHLLLEHGYDQQQPVARLLREHGFSDIHCLSDLNDLPRMTRAKRVENRKFEA